MEPNKDTDLQDRINAQRLFEHAQALCLTPQQIRDAAFHLQARPMRAEMVQAVRETLMSSLIDATEMIAVLDEVRAELVEKTTGGVTLIVEVAS